MKTINVLGWRILPRIIGAAIMLIGAMVLVGWLFDLEPLKRIVHGGASMKPNTAICFFLLGLTLWIDNADRRPATTVKTFLSWFAPASALGIALVVLVEYAFDMSFGMDEWLIGDGEDPGVLHPGRMAIFTAVNFSLLGAAFLLSQFHNPLLNDLGFGSLLIVFFLATLGLLGYLHGDVTPFKIGQTTPMAFHTVLAFALIPIAGLFLFPQRFSTGLIYGRTILIVVAAYALRLVLVVWTGPDLPPFVTFFPAVMVAALLGGWEAGLLATVFSSAVVDFWLLLPIGSFGISILKDLVNQIIFAGMGVFMTMVSHLYQNNRQRLEQQSRQYQLQLETEVQARTVELESEAVNHRRTAARLEAINRVFQQAPHCENEEALGSVCLEVAENLVGAQFGFIGLLNAEGLFDTLAISNPGWDACQVPAGQATLVIRNMPLRGVDRMTLVEGRSRIVNGQAAIASHADHVPTPSGHPPLTAFLGVPFKQGDKTVGMIALGNKDGGFDECDQADIEALVHAFIEALHHKSAELAVDQLNLDLAQRAAELETANKDLENFSYSVSHDLRAPLRAIDGFIAILVEEQAERLDDEGRRMFGIVADNARKMGDLIDDILAFSRAGRLQVEMVETEMRPLVEEQWSNLAKLPEGRAIELRIGDLPSAHCDPRAIRQVWQNLLTNAIKFTRGRPLALIEVSAQHEGDFVRYTVRDNGVGFNNDYVDKLFVLFQRLHGMDEFEGTGVGLAIVKRFVQKHGGDIHAQGWLDQGAEFSFTLPG